MILTRHSKHQHTHARTNTRKTERVQASDRCESQLLASQQRARLDVDGVVVMLWMWLRCVYVCVCVVTLAAEDDDGDDERRRRGAAVTWPAADTLFVHSLHSLTHSLAQTRTRLTRHSQSVMCGCVYVGESVNCDSRSPRTHTTIHTKSTHTCLLLCV